MDYQPASNEPTDGSNGTRNFHTYSTQPMTGAQVEAIRTGTNVQPGQSLADFFSSLEEFTPVIPDAVALYFMRKNGINNPDPKIVRLFSLSAQKFISDIVLDAMQQARVKGLGQVRKGTRETRFTLTNELLESVLEEYGVQLNKPEYYR